MSEPALKEVLAAFDEAALISLASKGLLRRARRDVEQNLADIVEQDGATAVIQADGEEVQLDTKGPAAARCSCPAAGMCRHILAAVLVMQAGGEFASDQTPQDEPLDDDDTDASAEQRDAPAESLDPMAEICGLTETEIAKWAGKAAMRAAREMLAEGAAPDIASEGRAVVVRFADDVPEIRYLSGLSLDGMVSKISKTKRKALHAAAVLAVRQGEGLETAPDERPDAQPSAGPVRPDAEFLNAVERCLADCVRTGFNKAPLVLEERLFALSVATRADDLPRLSRLLRAISAMVRSKRAREFTLDTHAYFSRVADAFMLVRALQSDEIAGDMVKLSALAGLVRQDYAATQTLDLFGAGAQVWQTGAGARGVTGYFYSAERNQWFSASLARSSGQDPGFKPMDAYRSEALWSAASLETLSRNRVVLTNPSVSADGRLSMAKTVSCVSTPWQVSQEAVAEWPACIHSWGELQSDLLRHFRPSLSEGQVAPCPVLLAPSHHAPVYFDELAQQTVWPLCDADGTWIGLTLPHGTWNDHISGHLEALAKNRTMWAVSALAISERDRFVLRPFAVWSGEGEKSVFNLGLDIGTMSRDKPLTGGERLRGFFRKAASAASFGPGKFRPAAPDNATSRTLRDAFDACLAIAELGRPVLEVELRQQLKGLVERCARIGLGPCEAALQKIVDADSPDVPEAVLGAAYIVNSAQALLRPVPWLASDLDA